MLVGGFLITTSKQFSKEMRTNDSQDHTDDIWNRGSNKGKGEASTQCISGRPVCQMQNEIEEEQCEVRSERKDRARS